MSITDFIRHATVLLWVTASIASARAGDWPEIHGPRRIGHATGETLADQWNTPPRQLWSTSLGEGYAGPAVVDGRVYVVHRRGNNILLDCLSAADGSKVWSLSWPAQYRGGIDADHGPRCVPVVRDGRVYVWTAGGTLHCASTDGKRLWTRDLADQFRANDGYFGFGSTPLVMGDHVMVNVGGRSGKSIVCVDAASGQDRWQAFQDQASYAAPIAWQFNQKPCALFLTRLNLVGILPKTGEILFQTPFGARGPTVNAAAPIAVDDEHVFLTASYRIGAKLLQVRGDAGEDEQVSVVWENDQSLSSQYPTPILFRDHLYGVHGREDGPAAALRCVDVQTGKVRWEQSGVGMAHCILADEKLLMLTVGGELVLFQPTPKAYQELGRVRVSQSTTRALPALSDGKLFVRSVDGKLTAWKIP